MTTFYPDLPRLSDLIAEYGCRYNSPIWSEWENLDQKPQVKKHFVAVENYIGPLPDNDWQLLKEKVVSRFQDYQPGRGWQQAFDVLYEALAYKVLLENGATSMAFVPEQTDSKTPDLCCTFSGKTVYCEVKTKNESDNQIQARTAGNSTSIQNTLTAEYFDQLATTMSCAEKKFAHLDCAKHMFFILNFDDHLHEYLDEYFVQIQNWIESCSHTYDRCWFWARGRFETRMSHNYELLVVDRINESTRHISASHHP
jgi:hypothetical protein